ncbi:MAG: septum formation initiator family protein [Pseudomonadota bacterium]
MTQLRWINIGLLLLAVLLQGRLWLSDGGFRKTQELRAAVVEQTLVNETQQARNDELNAEVLDLKNGRSAAEERARTDLGMIAPGESFYQVVSTASRY